MMFRFNSSYYCHLFCLLFVCSFPFHSIFQFQSVSLSYTVAPFLPQPLAQALCIFHNANHWPSSFEVSQTFDSFLTITQVIFKSSVDHKPTIVAAQSQAFVYSSFIVGISASNSVNDTVVRLSCESLFYS
jgi:hypothetical protein